MGTGGIDAVRSRFREGESCPSTVPCMCPGLRPVGLGHRVQVAGQEGPRGT